MLLRRLPDTAPFAAERVRSVLAREPEGWVPGADLGTADERPGSPAGGAESHGAPGTDEAEEPVVTRPGPRAPGSEAGASPSDPGGEPPLRALRLPVALTAGRLDPGRRGATALVVAALLAALVTGLVVLRGRPQEVAAPAVVTSGVPLPGTSRAPDVAGGPASPARPGPTAPSGEVVVAVAGEVVRPGLVRLPPGSRVDDAVRAAGGPLPGSGTGLLNLARVLVDGEQVLVGVDAPPGAPPPGAPAGAGATGAGGLLDLNAATVADFDALPGIGPVLAQRIVDWRSEHGRFASVEQLREVTGIGESKYADLEDEVTV